MKDIGADAKVHILFIYFIIIALYSILAGTPCKLARMSMCTFWQPTVYEDKNLLDGICFAFCNQDYRAQIPSEKSQLLAPKSLLP